MRFLTTKYGYSFIGPWGSGQSYQALVIYSKKPDVDGSNPSGPTMPLSANLVKATSLSRRKSEFKSPERYHASEMLPGCIPAFQVGRLGSNPSTRITPRRSGPMVQDTSLPTMRFRFNPGLLHPKGYRLMDLWHLASVETRLVSVRSHQE